MISDSTLYLGFIFLVCGLLNKSQSQIFLGIIVAALSRQTSILLVPIFMALSYFKYIKPKDLLIYSSILICSFLASRYSTAYFYNVEGGSHFKSHVLGGLFWLLGSPKFSEAFSFYGRYFFFLLTLSGLFFVLTRATKDCLLYMAFFFFIHLQPLMAGPLVTQGNVSRLCALGIPFLIPLVAKSQVEKKYFYYFILFSLVLSWHHNFSYLFLFPLGKVIFGFLVFIGLPLAFLLRKSSLRG